MSKERLEIPEGRLREFICVIRAGIEYSQGFPLISYETIHALKKWCDDEEKYLDGIEESLKERK